MQIITVTWLDGHEDCFTGPWEWEIADGLLWIKSDAEAKCIPLGGVRLARFEAD